MWPGKSSPRFNTNPNRLGFLDHLEEFRKRLLIILAALAGLSAAAWFFSDSVLWLLAYPLAQVGETELYFHAPYDAFLVHLKAALAAGFFLTSPVFLAELWLFLAPGLHREERRIVLPLTLASALLFLAGAAFALWIVVPLGLGFLLSYEGESLRPLLDAGMYLSFALGIMTATALVFVLPVVLLGLVRLKILNVQALRSARKAVIVSILVLAAVLTPSPDPVGQVLLGLPLYLLYEASLWTAAWLERKRA